MRIGIILKALSRENLHVYDKANKIYFDYNNNYYCTPYTF